MSISSHLSPEPERRLWSLLDAMGSEAERADWKILALAALALGELALLRLAGASGFLAWLGVVALVLAVPFALLALAPIERLPEKLSFLEPPRRAGGGEEAFVSPEGLAPYPQAELVLKLDRYLGGGVTAAPYHEDLVGEIGARARQALRKRHFLRWLCVLLGAGQLALLSLLFYP